MAGMKDKRAVTVQTITAKQVRRARVGRLLSSVLLRRACRQIKAESLAAANARVRFLRTGDYVYVASPIKLGDHSGTRACRVDAAIVGRRRVLRKSL